MIRCVLYALYVFHAYVFVCSGALGPGALHRQTNHTGEVTPRRYHLCICMSAGLYSCPPVGLCAGMPLAELTHHVVGLRQPFLRQAEITDLTHFHYSPVGAKETHCNVRCHPQSLMSKE